MTKLELKSSHEVIDTVNVADVESIFYCKPTDPDILTVVMKDGKRLYCDEVCSVDSLPEEPVSDLELAATKYAQDKYMPVQTSQAFKAGAQWQASQGVTKEAVIGMATEEIALDVSEHTLDALDLYPGDKVIIQIRKKED